MAYGLTRNFNPPPVTPPETSPTTRILIGGAGAPNYGDELIVKGWLDLLEQVGGGEKDKIILYQNSGGPSQRFHVPEGHPLSSRAIFRDTLTKIAKAESTHSFWQQVERGFTFMRDFGFAKHSYQGIREIFDATSIHLHGGGYLNDIRSDKAFLLGLAASFRKIYGMPVFATGIGFGPIKEACPDPARFEEILSHFDFFEVRDIEGFNLLSRLAPSAEIINGIDDCFIVPVASLFRTDSSKRRLHLSLNASHLEFIQPDFWEWLGRQASQFDETVFWESFAWNDREVIARILEVAPDCRMLATREVTQGNIPIGDDDVFLTHRFHVHFAAARAGARGFFIAPCSYYRQKHGSIVALGSSLMPFDFNDLPDLGDLPAGHALDESALRGRKLAVYDPSCFQTPPRPVLR